MTLVTIGLPVYNNESTLRAALDSLLAQDFQDFVLLISDNGSTDATPEICMAYRERDGRVHYYRQAEVLRPVLNYKFVLTRAKTPYFMWAAGDDLWKPGFISANLAYLETNRDYVQSQSLVRFERNGIPEELSRGTYALRGSVASNMAGFLKIPADNSRIYGLFRTASLKQAFPTADYYGWDWALTFSTLRYGKHSELHAELMIRDRTEFPAYARSIDEYYKLGVFWLFPVLDMSLHLLRAGVPVPDVRVYCRLLLLNVAIFLEYNSYRLKKAWHALTRHNSPGLPGG